MMILVIFNTILLYVYTINYCHGFQSQNIISRWKVLPSSSSYSLYQQNHHENIDNEDEFRYHSSVYPTKIDHIEIKGLFTPQKFAESKCWGRRPLLIRGAFSYETNHDNSWPTIDDLLSLSTFDDDDDEDDESGVECRIIRTSSIDDDYDMSMEIGPFPHEVLQNLLTENQFSLSDNNCNDNMHGRKKFSLLVNHVDRFFPSLADWIDINFSPIIPSWRRDDGQVSFANKGGGIGLHVDNYDVFLIQTKGKRKWEVGTHLVSTQEENERLIPDLDVSILKRNSNDNDNDNKSYVLEPGDCLYLPPRIEHCGTSLTDDCTTLSVGCRAPSALDMISKITEDMTLASTTLSSSSDSSFLFQKANTRYTDEDLLDQYAANDKNEKKSQNEITMAAKNKAKKIIKDAMNELLDNDDTFDKWFGSFVSESKRITRLMGTYPVSLDFEYDDEDDVFDISDRRRRKDELLEEHNEWISSLGIWGNAKEAVKSVLHDGKGFLYQAEGLTFAYSKKKQAEEEESTTIAYRLFINGFSWDIQNESVPIETIVNNRCLSIESFSDIQFDYYGSKEENSETIQLLEHLVQKGFLYGSDADE